jgi:nicotinate dehydrogenase subunit A
MMGMAMNALPIELIINGLRHTFELPPTTPLLYVLRNDVGLNGPKFGCGLGECGACAVLIGDRAARACTTSIEAAAPHAITTLEGLGTPERPHPVQRAFIETQAAQCGYCMNGMIIAVTALLRRSPYADEVAIRSALRRYLCRCGTHIEILAAARQARDLLIAGATGENPVPENMS